MKNNLWFLFLALPLLFSCGNNESSKVEQPDIKSEGNQEANIYIPTFNADSAYLFVKKQVDFGPRVPNTKAHEKCAEYLVSTFKRFGLKVTVQEGKVKAFDGTQLNIKNITASINPDASTRIMVTAHWDTRPFADQDTERPSDPIDGANDGGSGVAVILELARTIASSKQQPAIGVDLILFDAEDFGQPEGTMYPYQPHTYCLGSQYWSNNKPSNYTPAYSINLDMVGAAGAMFTMEGNSLRFAPGVVRKVWTTGRNLGYGAYFVEKETSPITDDHVYVNTIANIPAIDIIEFNPATPSNFSATWHTHKDNLSNIDKTTLGAVGQTLLAVIYREKPAI